MSGLGGRARALALRLLDAAGAPRDSRGRAAWFARITYCAAVAMCVTGFVVSASRLSVWEPIKAPLAGVSDIVTHYTVYVLFVTLALDMYARGLTVRRAAFIALGAVLVQVISSAYYYDESLVRLYWLAAAYPGGLELRVPVRVVWVTGAVLTCANGVAALVGGITQTQLYHDAGGMWWSLGFTSTHLLSSTGSLLLVAWMLDRSRSWRWWHAVVALGCAGLLWAVSGGGAPLVAALVMLGGIVWCEAVDADGRQGVRVPTTVVTCVRSALAGVASYGCAACALVMWCLARLARSGAGGALFNAANALTGGRMEVWALSFANTAPHLYAQKASLPANFEGGYASCAVRWGWIVLVAWAVTCVMAGRRLSRQGNRYAVLCLAVLTVLGLWEMHGMTAATNVSVLIVGSAVSMLGMETGREDSAETVRQDA